jgi:L,D-transpeptidase ErfK/SrfK
MAHLRILAPCLLATALLSVSGCATFQDFLGTPPEERGPVLPPLAEREEQEPISRNYFVLEAAGQTLIGEPQIVYTRDSDTFSSLAREYGLGYDELVAANPGVDPWLPGANVPVLLPTQYVLPDAPHRGIVLNIAAKRLYYFPDVAEGEPAVVMTYPIGIGRVGWETPTGEAKVVAKATDPHWYVPWSVQQEHRKAGNPLPSIVPPGPENPLGRHVLQLNMPGYLIHGTNKPWGVGMRVSHGCVRLYPENIELLYSLVMPGETVHLVNQPYLLGQRDGQVYLEAHAVLEDDSVSAEQHLANILAGERAMAAGLKDDAAQRDHARTIASAALGIPLRVTAGDTMEVYTRVRVVRNTVKTDPDAPTLAEVRELLDAAPESGERSTDGTAGAASNVQAMDATRRGNLDD